MLRTFVTWLNVDVDVQKDARTKIRSAEATLAGQRAGVTTRASSEAGCMTRSTRSVPRCVENVVSYCLLVSVLAAILRLRPISTR